MPGVIDSPTAASGFRPLSLDALNFLLADVRGALGPYLNVFLVTQQHWSQSEVGLVTTIGGLLGLVVKTPVGAAIDATRAKRGLVIAALGVLAVGATVIAAAPSFWPVVIANSVIAMVGDVFGPAIAALTLGLYVREHLARRMGRNAAFDHAGNVAIAVVAGAVGWAVSQRAVFLLVPIFSVLAAAAVLSIPARAIDHDWARGLEAHDVKDNDQSDPSRWKVLVECRPLVIFACCALLFHFANAPLLPLVGQKLAFAHPDWATAMMSSCIIAAQLIMLPIALLVGCRADQWGRKPLFLVGLNPDGNVGFRPASDLKRQRDVVGRRARRQQVEMLKDHADRTLRQPQLPARERGNITAIDHHAAGGWLFQAIDQPDQTRLPCARSADHASDRSTRNSEIDLLQRLHTRLVAIGRIGLRNALEADHGFRFRCFRRDRCERRNRFGNRKGLMCIHSQNPISIRGGRAPAKGGFSARIDGSCGRRREAPGFRRSSRPPGDSCRAMRPASGQ